MSDTTNTTVYRPTESQYKGGAQEMYVTYELDQATRGGGQAIYPKVRRVYIAGEVKHWTAGQVTKRSGRAVNGVRIEYEQTRRSYRRQGYRARRDSTDYEVAPAAVAPSHQRFVKVVEVPEAARNIHFYADEKRLPARYRSALQAVR
jgi:hypothetical protein